MYVLKQYQEKAVAQLLDHTYEAMRLPQAQVPLLLEAPTGSGKTVMMASYLERLVDELHLQPGLSDNVAFIWFAPNTLHLQSYNGMKAMYADSRKLNCLELGSLGTDPTLQPRDLLFVNWASVDKDKNLWRRDNETNTNLESLIEKTKGYGTKIILIIDEAHLSAFSGRQAIKVRELIKAKVEVSVTATPGIRPPHTVRVSRQDVVAQEMIKKGVRLNIGLDPAMQRGDNLHIHLLRTAMAKREELKALYAEELGEEKLNPLLLIQLPSDNVTLSEDDRKIREVVEGLLNSDFNITTQNGRLAVWLSGERDTDRLEEANAMQDVLIFKQAIAQGWDCPRAAVLISYRNVQNASFGVQTVGRILRMPHQRHYVHDELNHGYVYTNLASTQINLIPSDSDYFHMQLAKRQEDRGWLFDSLPTATVVNDRANPGVLTLKFDAIFFKVMADRYGVVEVPEKDLLQTDEEREKWEADRVANRLKMEEGGWSFDIGDHQIVIPADMDIDPYSATSIVVDNDHLKRFNYTKAEFNAYFDRFCFESITRLNRSKSWKKLRDTLICFGEYYLCLEEQETKRLCLYPQNKSLLIQHIVTALENFDAWQKAKGNEKRRIENVDWQVPEFRYYTDRFDQQDADTHALEPFYEYQEVLAPERQFRQFLKQHEAELQWWYKNGDKGREHFAVPYTVADSDGNQVPRLFYVDFILKYKSGKIGLYDTKTSGSDPDAPAKHNALLDYVEAENGALPDRKLIGSLLLYKEVQGEATFRWTDKRIADTGDESGWEFLDLRRVNGER